jgi:hypothetical protein
MTHPGSAEKARRVEQIVSGAMTTAQVNDIASKADLLNAKHAVREIYERSMGIGRPDL